MRSANAIVKKQKLRAGSLGKYFYIFILPALVIYLIFSITPFLFTIYYSFTDYTDLNPIYLSFVGFKNYSKVFETPVMLKAISNSVIYAILLTGFQVILGLPIAVVLDNKFKTRNLLRAAFFFPAVFSALIVGYLWNFILSSSDSGLINNLLHQLGFGTFNFFTANRALYSVILTQVWQWTGWAMVIFLANLQGISKDLYEAAEIDGARAGQRFFKITLPLMCPSVKIVVVTGLIGGMKVFDIIYSMTSGGPGDATQTVMTVMMKRGISDGFYSTGAAFGVCFFVIVMTISAVITRLMGKWSDQIQ
ncbi:MAG: sugar ABC transporter permease [Eubacteriales bacterium]|nr:sugar ABC transporter permease [Eubacteriales bacterium]